MSVCPGTSSPNHRRKVDNQRRYVQRLALQVIVCRLQRAQIWRTSLQDLAQPHGAASAQPRTKRKANLSSRWLDMLSSSTSGEDPPTCDPMLDGPPDSSTDFPMDFSFQSTQRVRRRLATLPSDLPQADDTSSLEFCKKRKPTALETSRRVSRWLNEPSCSIDEDEQLSSALPISSNGRRRFCRALMSYSMMNTLGSVVLSRIHLMQEELKGNLQHAVDGEHHAPSSTAWRGRTVAWMTKSRRP